MAKTMKFGSYNATRRDTDYSRIDWTFIREDGSTVVVWYNFDTRDWVVALECDGGQCGTSDYVARKSDVRYSINFVSHDIDCEGPQAEAERAARRARYSNPA